MVYLLVPSNKSLSSCLKPLHNNNTAKKKTLFKGSEVFSARRYLVTRNFSKKTSTSFLIHFWTTGYCFNFSRNIRMSVATTCSSEGSDETVEGKEKVLQSLYVCYGSTVVPLGHPLMIRLGQHGKVQL